MSFDKATWAPINSVWRAKDGRRMRVTSVTESPFACGGWWAELDVLPPHAPRQRRKTSAQGKSFEDGFLVKEADFG